MKNNKDIHVIAFEYFLVFLMVHGCLTFEEYQIFAVHRTEHREFKSAKIFCSSLLIFETEAFFLTMRNNSVMPSVEKQKVFMQ
jgi:hypothetical protein